MCKGPGKAGGGGGGGRGGVESGVKMSNISFVHKDSFQKGLVVS